MRYWSGKMFTVLIGLALAPAATGAMTLVQKGMPKATIVVAAEATKEAPPEGSAQKVAVAARDLQVYLEKMSGAKLPIVADEEKPQGALILVGKSQLTDAMNVSIPAGLTNARREEGFVIVCQGRRLLLAGNDEGPYHGTEYAVYEFLNRLGVRWFMPGEFGEIVPPRATITVDNLRVSEKPDFVMRNWWLHETPEMVQEETRWKIRNKMNPDAMFATPGDSSARNILPESVYFKEHPEYFAMNPDGSRNPYLPNLTSPQAVEAAAGIIKDYFRQRPEANSYGFAPDDGLPRDYNPETVKLNQGFVDLLGRPGVPGEVSTSEEWFTFVNKVTAAVRKEFPDAYIATNGYANRNLPPQGVPLDDHLVIMFAAIWSCTVHAYDDDHCWQKVRQGQMLRRWCELCDNVWIYGYNEQVLVSALTPIPEVHKLRRDFPLLKQWGVLGFLDEARPVWTECTVPSRTLRARLEWDADADVDAILGDFYTQWYGRAAKSMRAFYEALDRAFEKTPMHGHEDRFLPEVYTPELMVELRERVEEAERLADTERTQLHVRVDRLVCDHLQGYVDLSAAEAAGDFAEAARQAGRMLRLRKQLHEINPFLMPEEEVPYSYYGVGDRQKYYQSLADRTSGQTGDLVALLPDQAMFRTDPHEDGTFAEWYRPDLNEAGWKPLLTTRPFYGQGYEDAQGHPYVGYLWYRLKVDVPASAPWLPRGGLGGWGWRKVMLYAPVVETEAWGWVNGCYVGHRPYMEAYIRPNPLEFDVTDAIRPGETNQVTIRVSTSLAPAQAASGLLSRLFLYAPKE